MLNLNIVSSRRFRFEHLKHGCFQVPGVEIVSHTPPQVLAVVHPLRVGAGVLQIMGVTDYAAVSLMHTWLVHVLKIEKKKFEGEYEEPEQPNTTQKTGAQIRISVTPLPRISVTPIPRISSTPAPPDKCNTPPPTCSDMITEVPAGILHPPRSSSSSATRP